MKKNQETVEIDSLELEGKVSKSLKDAIYLIVGKITVEYLTINLFPFVRAKLIETKSTQSDEITAKKDSSHLLLNETEIEELTEKAAEIFSTGVDSLQKSVLEKSENIFYRLFSVQNKAKPKFKKLVSYSKSPPKKDQPQKKTGAYRVFRHFLFVKLFFPALLYQADSPSNPKKKSNGVIATLKRDGTALNRMVKSAVGVLAAFGLTYLIYLYLRHQLRADLFKATVTLTVVFALLSYGLGSNWPKFRCVVLLTIPYLATSRGRALVLMNSISMTTNLLVPNMFANVEQLQRSFMCNKQLIGDHFMEWSRESDVALWTLDKVERIKSTSRKVQKRLNYTKSVLKSSGAIVNKAYKSLKNISSYVNDSLYNIHIKTCQYVIEKLNFGTKIGVKFYNWKKSIKECFFDVDMPDITLGEINFFNPFFKLGNFVNMSSLNINIDQIIDPIIEEFDTSAEYEVIIEKDSSGVNYRELLSNLTATYKERLEWLNQNVFARVYLIVPLSIVLIVVSSVIYHDKYLRRDEYDNKVIGVKFYELDAKRVASGKLGLLPLRSAYVRDRFVGLFESRMTAKEKKFTVRSLLRLLVLIVPLLIALWADTALASLTDYLGQATQFSTEWEPGEAISIDVKGQGYFANNFRDMFDRPKTEKVKKLDNSKCIPQTSRLDSSVHKTIVFNFVLLFFLGSFQSYIKRLRPFFCACFYPNRDQERSVWLYNHLLTVYSSMNLWKVKAEENEPKKLSNCQVLTKLLIIMCCPFFAPKAMIDLLKDRFPYLFSRKLFMNRLRLKMLPLIMIFKRGKDKFMICSNCYEAKDTDSDPMTKCSGSKCKGWYCLECIDELKNRCKLCGESINKDDDLNSSSDETVIEEIESSEEENNKMKIKKTILYQTRLTKEAVHENDPDCVLCCRWPKSSIQHYIVNVKSSQLNKLEVISYDKRRIKSVIEHSLKIKFYEQLREFVDSKEFISVVKNSEYVREIFQQQFDLVRTVVPVIIRNFVMNIKLDEL